MHKVLMVGCGGSGAKTLAFMMDQLRADLAAHGIDEIPGCWEFVSVDSPLQEEGLEKYGVPRVSDQGGHYVSCGVAQPYPVTDAALVSSLQGGRNNLRHLATVLPKRPNDITVSTGVGAGQLRALGRLLVLGKLEAIKRTLAQSLERMSSLEAEASATAACAKLPGAGDPPSRSIEPVVFIVSSMAGGSGASMTLEVARILASLPGVDSSKISLMLYTADVFGAITSGPTAGMPGNTLAFLGEAIAAQLQGGGHAGTMDAELHEILQTSTTPKRPFHRIFPIGSMSATGEKPQPEVIYRSIGRGLARYVSSTALNSFVQYVLANAANSQFQWDMEGTAYAWSSIGYASLSMGRDRYAEYAAQRLARRALDHAMWGHRAPNHQGGDQQRMDELWAQYGGHFLTGLGFGVAAQGALDEGAVGQWFSATVADDGSGIDQFRAVATKEVNALLQGMPAAAPGLPAHSWAANAQAYLHNANAELTSKLEAAGVEIIRAWSARLVANLEDSVRREIFARGLRYALAATQKVAGPVKNLATALQAASVNLPDATALPSLVTEQLGRLRANEVLQQMGMEHLRQTLVEGLVGQAHHWLFLAAAAKAAAVLSEYENQVLKPMERALDDARAIAERDMAKPVQVQGVASLGTSIYQAWPTEPKVGDSNVDAVPKRFALADNEVTIMQVGEYVPRFAHDVSAAVEAEVAGQPDQSDVVKLAWATGDVLLGQWFSQGGEKPPADLIERVGNWTPNALPLPSMTATYSPASFTVHMRSEDVLRRARKFVWRTGESFHGFVTQSIADYLNDHTVNAAVQQERAAQMVAAMKTTIGMGRPYTTDIDPLAFRRVQPNDNPGLLYTFSMIPFPESVLQELRASIKTMSSLNTEAVEAAFKNAVSNDPVTRVDVFGSAPSTVPVCYSGMLRDIADAWGHVKRDKELREDFWKMRRARPLGASLPYADVERKALIRGWFLAAIAGGLIVPRDENNDFAPVMVWDKAMGEWVAFPAPMITCQSQFRVEQEWLPAVLESILLAYLEASQAGADINEVFRPWQVLRSWADADPSKANPVAARGRADFDTLQAIVDNGRAAPGLEEFEPSEDLPQDMTPAEARKATLIEWLEYIAEDVDEHFLPGPGKYEDHEHWTNLSRREYLLTVPNVIDIAQEMKEEALVLRSMAEKCTTGVQPTSRRPRY